MVKNLKFKDFIKKNYEFIFCFFLLFLILIIAINPKSYIGATLKGFTIWAKIVLPSLFCFFIFTKLLMQNNATIKLFNFLNKPFEKIFKTSKIGGYTFFMSAISGYPVGAKLVSEFYENGTISKDEAFKLSCYASTTGPMFIIGSVGVSMFNNVKLGIIVLLSHLISALINGLIFRNYSFDKNKDKKLKDNSKNFSKTKTITKIATNKKQSLNDIMYNTIISVVMVGGYIALCFTILEVLNYLNILKGFGFLINKILPQDAQIGESILKGILELTNGCVSLSSLKINVKIACVALSFLASFGGFSIHLQSYLFLSKCNISYKHFFISKVTHSIIAVFISIIFSIILL